MLCSLPVTSRGGSTSSNSASTFESDCISSPSDYSSEFYCVRPNDKSHPPNFASTGNRADAIFSFAWSESNPIDMSETPAAVVDSREAATKPFHKYRHKPPTLPLPVFWSTITDPGTFEDYIKAEGLQKVWNRVDITLGKAEGVRQQQKPPLLAQVCSRHCR